MDRGFPSTGRGRLIALSPVAEFLKGLLLFKVLKRRRVCSEGSSREFLNGFAGLLV